MKKVILLITILFVSVISTACINNLAVQELNNKAKEYMANGETEKAICRLRSSIDLDASIFETHYNLGVALIEAKEYKEAQTALLEAIKLKPDFADSYYSLAVSYEGEADQIINNTSKEQEQEDITQDTQNSEDAGLLQYSKTLDSLDTKLNNISTSFQQFYMDIFNGPVIGAGLEFINNLIKGFNKLGKITSIFNIFNIVKGIKQLANIGVNSFSGIGSSIA